ncbi:MAG: hypothetical protein KDA50_11645, partial [Rhodobacteraceae bacterium]|nr:hypothetical protein [Paracoccaceae bacterium]
ATPMMEKIVHTAKQAVKATVLSPRARVWSEREAVAVVCMTEPPVLSLLPPQKGSPSDMQPRVTDLLDLDHVIGNFL